MNIFIVIPFYNEEKHIIQVVKNIAKYKLNIILVDDGSINNLKPIIKDLKIKNLILLTHKINLGKGAAMKTGAEFAFENGADAVIFMDGDGQHESDDIPKFVETLKSGRFDAVFGTRNYSSDVPLVRYLGNKLISIVLNFLFKIYVSDVLCGFKGFTKKAYKNIKWDSAGYGVETEITVRTGKTKLNFCEVPIRSIYHDKVKGVTILDGISVLGEIIKWRFTI